MGWLKEQGYEDDRRIDASVSLDDKLEEIEEDQRKFRRWLAILRAARSPAPVEYLRSRGLEEIPKACRSLRREDTIKLKLPLFPAMVFPMIDRKGLLLGAHVTTLTRDGMRKAQGPKSPKLAYGNIRGGFIPLFLGSSKLPLLISEGIENALSGRVLSGLPCIAAYSATNMEALEPPKASEYIILADNDENEAGILAARVLQRRLEGEGYRVRIVIPPEPGTDWNDVLRQPDAQAIWDEAFKNPRREFQSFKEAHHYLRSLQ